MPLSLKTEELNWSWKSFGELNTSELYEVLSFRQSIFVVEQESWYQDADGLDECGEHLLVKDKNKLIGYLRLIPPGMKYDSPSIGRIAISKEYRRNSIGSKIVEEGLRKSATIYSSNSSTISAQEYLISFYEDHGFKTQGEVYDEDGIPHVKMVKK